MVFLVPSTATTCDGFNLKIKEVCDEKNENLLLYHGYASASVHIV